MTESGSYWLHRLAHNRSGNIAIIAAASLPLLVGVLALGVDWGYLGYQKRKAQTDTDLAAISAAAALSDPGDSLRRYAADNDLKIAVMDDAAYAGMSSAAKAGDTMTYALGHYDPAADIAPGKRFAPGASPANAVRVTLHRRADLGFARAFMAPPEITTVATAGRDAQAAFSIGSRLASLNGGLLNAVLGGLLGTTVNLDVMDYRALVDVDVDVLGFLKTANTKLHLNAATYDDVLSSSLTVGDALGILAATDGLTGTARLALRKLADATRDNRNSLDLAALLDLGDVGHDPIGTPRVSATAGVLDLVSAAAAVADGGHQVAINAGAALPGIAKLSLTMFVGEPPKGSAWFAIGGPGTLVRTAQTRLKLDATIGGDGLLAALQIHLPLYLQIAYGEATLAGVRCAGSSPDSATVDVNARPGVAEAWVGDGPSDLSRITSHSLFQPARLLDARLVRVDGSAHANATNAEATALHFSAEDIRDGNVRTVSTHDTVSTLLSSLIGGLDLKANVLGLPLATPALVEQALAHTLAAATRPLDDALSNVLLALGVRIGEADVRVTGVECGRPVLVQ